MYSFHTSGPTQQPLLLAKFNSCAKPKPMLLVLGADSTALPMSWLEELGHKKHLLGSKRLQGIQGTLMHELILRLFTPCIGHWHTEESIRIEDENGVEWKSPCKTAILFTKALDKLDHGLIGRDFIGKLGWRIKIDASKRPNWEFSFE